MPACILIVEDNADNLKLMSYLLRAFGHTIQTADDGAAALDIIQRESFDLIVCDIQLPKLDGYAVARHLKADPTLGRIPLIAVTALAMVGDKDKVLAQGFDGYISKPIVPRTFVSQVEAFLRPELHARLQPAAPAASMAPARPARRATVLVVDNAPVNLELAAKILEPFGYVVVTAHSVAEALVLARQNAPDLILSDVHMPRQSGFDLIRAVKADNVLRTIPFIFISSTVWQDIDREQGLSLGAAKFLLRPIDPKKLLTEVDECLRQRKEGGHG